MSKLGKIKLVALASAVAVPLQAQDTLWDWAGGGSFARFGDEMAGQGDLNGDGVLDVAVGAPAEDAPGMFDVGHVFAFSGADGQLLWSRLGSTPRAALGSVLLMTRDVDGDGLDDVITHRFDGTASHLDFLSGADGTLVQSWPVPNATQLRDLDHVGDVDLDGTTDYVAGYDLTPDDSAVQILSGSDGQTLQEWQAEQFDDLFGAAVSGAGDVDGDGSPDVLVGAPFFDVADQAVAGKAYLFSSATGAELFSWTGYAAGEKMGWAVDAGADLDADGVPDVLVGGEDARRQGGLREIGRVRLYSGATGELLWSFYGEQQDSDFGSAVAFVGDATGDGVHDFVVGARNQERVYLFSGASRAVVARWTRPTRDFSFYGEEVTAIGDLNGDGLSDIGIGASLALDGRASAVSGEATFDLAAPVPGRAGETNTFTASGLTAGSTVVFVAGFQTGTTDVPGCDDLVANFFQPTVLGSATADATGVAQLEAPLPAPTAGRTLHVQSIDLGACTTSDLVSTLIE